MTFEARNDPIRLGVVGLGRAFVLTLPAFREDARLRLVAVCAPRADSRSHFARAFGGRTYEDVSHLAADPDVEVVYVATPHQMHVDHALAAARAGKHILIEKPLAISLEDGRRIVEAAEAAGVQLIVGPSHSFDGPVAQARELIDSGEFGAVRMIQALNYTDFLYRPRRPEELRTGDGGGVIFSQGIHQIDVVRLLAGGCGRDVAAVDRGMGSRASDRRRLFRPSLSTGVARQRSHTLATRISTATSGWTAWANSAPARTWRPTERRAARWPPHRAPKTRYGSRPPAPSAQPPRRPRPRPTSISARSSSFATGADLRLTPFGVHVHGEARQEFRPAPPFRHGRAEIVDALAGALRCGRPPSQNGRWGLASLEVCHAILESAETGGTVRLKEQVPYRKER